MITPQHSSIAAYKRNQVEEAISRIFYPDRQKPPSELRTQIEAAA
jgi:hypothetical protein